MDNQLTAAELKETKQLLQDYGPAQEAIALLEKYNGRLDKCFDELWIEKNESQKGEFDRGERPSLWEVTLKTLRKEICGDEGLRSRLSKYVERPTDAVAFTAIIIYLVELTTLPINPAIATPIVLYILKIGLNVFCEYTEKKEEGYLSKK